MDIGLALPQFDFSIPGERPLRWQSACDWAQKAERLGFSDIWLADHLFWDLKRYGGPDGTYDVYDPLAGLAALARLTTEVRLGLLVASVPLRPPSVLAKAIQARQRRGAKIDRKVVGHLARKVGLTREVLAAKGTKA